MTTTDIIPFAIRSNSSSICCSDVPGALSNVYEECGTVGAPSPADGGIDKI